MPKKVCPKCRRPGEFYKNAARPDGLSYWCKSCTRKSSDPAVCAAKQRARNKTPRGRAVSAWNAILQRAGNADGRHPAYAHVQVRMTRDAFLRWAEPTYAKWLAEHPGVTPSIDRRKTTGHYELGNLRIISLSENSRLQAAHKNVHAPKGKAWCSFCRAYYRRNEFYKNRHAPHGLQFICKSCSSKTNIASRRKHKA